MELTDANKYKCAYFVRVSADNKDKAGEAFRITETVDAGVDGEFAFVTEVMDNTAFEAAAAKCGGVINRIRLI